jgi:predicted nucleic acid-binding protein
VAPVTVEVARRYGEVFATLRRNGTPIPANGIWIAATTLEVGGHLLTFDHDFATIAGLPHDVLSPA